MDEEGPLQRMIPEENLEAKDSPYALRWHTSVMACKEEKGYEHLNGCRTPPNDARLLKSLSSRL